jgi:hypothetical protein
MSENARRPARDLTPLELTAQLGDQLSRLLRDEVALAKAEMVASARQAVAGGGMLAAAAVAGLAGVGVMVAAAVAGIALKLPVWAAALIAGGAFLAVAGGLALLAIRRFKAGMPPLKMTADTIRGDVTELATRARR